MTRVDVRIALPEEASIVRDILVEASTWVDARGVKMWQLDELDAVRIEKETRDGLFALAWCDGEAGGTVKFQLEDPEFWPDLPDAGAAYIHRLAIRRRYAGGLVSGQLLRWAVAHAGALGRQMLRLDCDAHRTSLRGVYEKFGFRYHSDRQVGPYYVARYEYPLSPASGSG
jgi:GNAT superfamily N-acetyltransferase